MRIFLPGSVKLKGTCAEFSYLTLLFLTSIVSIANISSTFCPSVSSVLVFTVNLVYSSSCKSRQDAVTNCQNYTCLWSLNINFHGDNLVLLFLTPTGGDKTGHTFTPVAAAVSGRTYFAFVTSSSRLSPQFSRLI